MFDQNNAELMKEALAFYSNPKNYEGNPSPVQKDQGHIARHILDSIKTASEQMEDYRQKFEEQLKAVDELKNNGDMKDVFEEIVNIQKLLGNGR